jgi:NAD(P)-dependent dehydrogenase (short-subunit alcohol dehydrogenase family)
MKGIAGRIHVVTGAARGIGCATARVLAQNGGRVVITDLASSDGESTAREIATETGGDVRFMSLDVTDSAAVDALAARIEREVGPVHGLVANAGIHKTDQAFAFSDEDWRQIIAVNLDGAFYCCRSFGNLLRGRGGSIALISSIAATSVVRPETSVAYGVAKAGVAHMAALLGVEWAKERIRVNAVAPGYTETPMVIKTKTDNPDFVRRWLDDIPIGRLLQPEEIANVLMFLLSDLSSAMTCALVTADGGYTR